MSSSLMYQSNLHLGPHFTSFKLYDNPHYNDTTQHNQTLSYNPIVSHKKPHHSSLTMHNKGTQNEIDCLKAELELERKMRRKFESLNQVLVMELAEERREREDAEQRLKMLEGEVACNRMEVENALSEIEEERRMLRVAELWREERVQIKISEAKFIMEEKIREITEYLYLEAAARKAGEVGPTDQSGQENKISQNYQQKKEAHENHHIKRGIKGFVEFPKTIKVQAKEARIDLESNLECQRAQLRVLLRNKGSSALVLIGNAQNLVM